MVVLFWFGRGLVFDHKCVYIVDSQRLTSHQCLHRVDLHHLTSHQCLHRVDSQRLTSLQCLYRVDSQCLTSHQCLHRVDPHRLLTNFWRVDSRYWTHTVLLRPFYTKRTRTVLLPSPLKPQTCKSISRCVGDRLLVCFSCFMWICLYRGLGSALSNNVI